MFDFESILKLGTKETIILKDLYPLAKKAIEAEKLIKETYLFPIGQNSIEIWHDEHNAEYITHDGIWQARYLHQSYNVECTAESIFDYMKAAYLIKNKYVPKFVEGKQTDEGIKAEIFNYFSAFLKKTEKLSKRNLK